MDNEPLEPVPSSTLKSRWNRLGRHTRAAVVVLALAAVVLVVKAGVSMRAETVTRLPANLIQNNECQNDQDCKGPHLVCNQRRTCEALPNPTGSCTQPQVLTYLGSNNFAKHTFCERGCILSDKGARCQ